MRRGENGSSAVALAGTTYVIVMVLEPESNGLEATRELLRSDRQARVILTTLHEIPSFVDEARRVGACGCFFKSVSGRHLIPAVRVASQRKPFFTPDDLEYPEIR